MSVLLTCLPEKIAFVSRHIEQLRDLASSNSMSVIGVDGVGGKGGSRLLIFIVSSYWVAMGRPVHKRLINTTDSQVVKKFSLPTCYPMIHDPYGYKAQDERVDKASVPGAELVAISTVKIA
ncbi:hypothetical protein [Endozoicomonas sp.]|uniref:hypothetical protein n=1 Tax=Endozoicomonas sp. TaxID=1892382 RepID=UPI002888EE1D|nr:hypothetical protein [Endozoicomonas sp.]